MAETTDLLHWATSQVGVKEGEREYATEYWCSKFTSFVLDQVGLGYYRNDSPMQQRVIFGNEGRLYTAPQVGTLCFVDLMGQAQQATHVGIVEEVRGTQVQNIEGNIQDTLGNAVVGRKVRQLGDGFVMDFGYPDWSRAMADLSDEVEGLIAYMKATNVPHRVISTYRPNAVTSAGHPSRHATTGTNGVGLAVDFAGVGPGRDTPELRAVFDAFVPVEKSLHELIYAQAPYNIKAGKRVPPYAVSGHHDHVHVSVAKGVVVKAPAPPEEEDEMPIAPNAVVDHLDDPEALARGEKGWWELQADGGVNSYGTASFFGSYPGLPPAQRQGTRYFTAISHRRDGRRGYTLWANDGAKYVFGP